MRLPRHIAVEDFDDFTVEGRGEDAIKIGDFSPSFISDSQDVKAIREYLGVKSSCDGHDSYFVIVGDGDYIGIWGMYGIIPYLDRTIHRVYPKIR